MKRFTIAIIVDINAEDAQDAYEKGIEVADAGYSSDPSTDLTFLEVLTEGKIPMYRLGPEEEK